MVSCGTRLVFVRSLLVFTLAASGLAACSGSEAATGLMLVVDADTEVRERAALLEVRILGTLEDEVNELAPLVYGEDEDIGWPRRVAIAPLGGDAERTLELRISARESGSAGAFIAARVITGFEADQRLELRVVLEARCIGSECGAEPTCFEGACVDPRDAWQPEPIPDCSAGRPNACGGCARLSAQPGSECGPCGLGHVVCEGSDAVQCDVQGACWDEVAAGRDHTCGRLADGTLWCWGAGDAGQRGDGSTVEARATPARVVTDTGDGSWSDWTAVASGGTHTCGLRAGGTLWCWGEGTAGRLGDGSTTSDPRARPTQVLASVQAGENVWSDWVKLTAGSGHTCGVRENDTLWCWGMGATGRLGNGGFQDNPRPTQVVRASEAGGGSWSDWVDVAAGTSHTCGLRANGTLWCWGFGGAGQLGNGVETPQRSTPIQVLASEDPDDAPWEDWVEVTAGWDYTCGRRADGTLWCWGDGFSGRRGDGSTTARHTVPTQVLASFESGDPPWSDWTSVAASEQTCGTRDDGTLWCWGAGHFGKRGDGSEDVSRTVPIQVLADGEPIGGDRWDDWLTPSTGSNHTCALRGEGSLWCWGRGDLGQRGDGFVSPTRSTPAPVANPAY